MTTRLRLGTRGSQLALYQANTVARLLAKAGEPPCDIVVIKTTGDRIQGALLSEVGGKRLFVKEIEDALLNGDVDLAVHSSKDMPAILPDGLGIASVLPREDPHDAVVLPAGRSDESPRIGDLARLLEALGDRPAIGTSSVRRIAQLTRLLPKATFRPIRGNLDTRLRKLDAGEHDALVLAAAGLRRLDLGARISFTLPATACVPAPGQGIIAIEARSDDARVHAAARRIMDESAWAALRAERALVEALGGGCQTPVGALATSTGGDGLELVAVVVALDGSREVRGSAQGAASQADDLGQRVAADLIARGAGSILEAAQRLDAERPAGAPSP
jgi:hydroxymethylbilane synthase